MDETSVLLDRDALLDTMGLTAYLEATRRLSAEGKGVLEMMSATEHYTADMDYIDTYLESTAIDNLNRDDQQIIEVYLARATLIEEFRTFEG